jgi:hypothetical protein
MNAAIAAEYDAVTVEATTSTHLDQTGGRRLTARLRRELLRIEARDFFSPPERDIARRAIDDLGTTAVTEAQR